MLRANIFAAFVHESAAASESTGPDWWTLAAGLVAGVIVAVANHFLTQSRERDAWLREQQISANRDFFSCAQELMTLAVRGTAEQQGVPEESLREDPRDAIARVAISIGHKASALLPIAEPRTIQMSQKVILTLPRLAFLAVPLSHTNYPAASRVRGQAINEMADVIFDLGMTMRQDTGLSGWRERTFARKNRTQPLLLIAPDRRPGGLSELPRFLREWHVRTLDGDSLPDGIDGYRVDGIEFAHEDVGPAVAAAAKPPTGDWRFGVVREISDALEQMVIADAVRLVTGHEQAYDLLLNPMAFPLNGGIGYVWTAPEVDAFDQQN